ncbi:MAG TPA: peptidase S1, partial [Oribacterium sp.]|nr:peptidase S1 [Oribacterium sp.]
MNIYDLSRTRLLNETFEQDFLRRFMMKKVAGIVAGALLFGAVAGASMVGVNVAAQKAGITYQTESSTENTAETTQATETAGETQAAAASSTGAQASTMGYGSVSEVAKNAMPSVVAITNMMKYQANGFSLFGNSQNYETEVPASGSGVIVGKNDTELLIVTNNHVVTDSTSLSVTFCDEESVDAEIKGTDASADLAVVAVKLSDIPEKTMDAIKIISIGNSDDLQVGDQVVAIGNALGYGQSVTTGIISAKDRDVQTSEGTESGLLQTDAAINPGNSGGAL